MMNKNMLAVTFEGEGKFKVGQVPMPCIKKGNEVLIKVEKASICGTDVMILKSPPAHPATKGVILGHEYVGIVEDFGEKIHSISKGDRVVIEPNINCGLCRYCKAGYINLCENMRTLGIFEDGGFAEYSVVPINAVHKISSNLLSEKAVLVEPLSCVVNGTNKLNFQQGSSILVLGAGPIGLLFIKVLKSAGAGKIIVSEISSFRRKFAKKSGASVILDPRKGNIVDVVKAETGVGVDIVIDCVGGLLEDALKCCRKGGQIILFGLNTNATNKVKPFNITHGEIKITGSYIAKYTFPLAIKILENNVIDVSDLITHKFLLKDFEKGLNVMKEGQAVKVIITP